MTHPGESKHDRFLRLMQKRLGRVLEDLRLVSQLSSPNYENTPEEAEEVVRHLDTAVRGIAEVFGVEYATRIGKGSSQTTNGAKPVAVMVRKTSILDEVDVLKVLECIRAGETEAATKILRMAISGRAA